MRIIEQVSEMQQQADSWRRDGNRIVFVPTMGYLHAGHLALMEAAHRHGDQVVVSIFVNPTQFGPGEDYLSYPRDLEQDLRLADGVGVDVAFLPSVEEIYPAGFQTYVEVTQVTRNLCGRSRPAHFRGVTTVVLKLFQIVKPHAAVFGEKDFQQLVTIRRMVRDLHSDVTVVGHPIVREADGLAMSSRNIYLNEGQRQSALRLNQSLKQAQAMVDAGERTTATIIEAVCGHINGAEELQIDYVEMCDPETLEDVTVIEGPTLLALAVRVGKARLIDNSVLQPPE
jgi:pantoate--beta-alanine ligase